MSSDETNAEVKELTPEETPPAADKQEPTVEELQKQLADKDAQITTKEAEKQALEANYKAMQRNLETERQKGKANAETQRILEELQESWASTQDDVEVLKQINLESVTSAPTPKKSRLDTLREEKAAKASVNQTAENALNQMRQMVMVSGLDSKAAAEATDAARIAYEAGKYDESVALCARGLSQAKRAPVVSEKDIEERASLKALQMMKDKGLLDVELGGATAASSGSMEQVEEKYMRGEISSSEYEAALKKHT